MIENIFWIVKEMYNGWYSVVNLTIGNILSSPVKAIFISLVAIVFSCLACYDDL